MQVDVELLPAQPCFVDCVLEDIFGYRADDPEIYDLARAYLLYLISDVEDRELMCFDHYTDYVVGFIEACEVILRGKVRS